MVRILSLSLPGLILLISFLSLRHLRNNYIKVVHKEYIPDIIPVRNPPLLPSIDPNTNVRTIIVSNGSNRVHINPKYDLLYFNLIPFLTNSTKRESISHKTVDIILHKNLQSNMFALLLRTFLSLICTYSKFSPVCP